MLGVVVDAKALDLLALIEAEGAKAFRTRFLKLLRPRTPRRVCSAWFDTARVSEAQKKMATSLNEWLRMVDWNIRQAGVTHRGNESSSGPQALLVSFTCSAPGPMVYRSCFFIRYRASSSYAVPGRP